jgi:hypothetical protein
LNGARDGIGFELVTAGEIKLVELACGTRAAAKAPCDVLDLLRDAGAPVGDLILALRPTTPA